MKNKKLLFLISGILVVVLVVILSVSLATCHHDKDNNDSTSTTPTHTHTYDTVWSKNETKHWHAATCGDDTKSDEANHTYGDALETADGKTKQTCTVCGYEKLETSKYVIDETKWNDLLNNTHIYTAEIEDTYDGTTTVKTKYSIENAVLIDIVDTSKELFQKDGDSYYAYTLTYGGTAWTKEEVSDKDFYGDYYNNLEELVDQFSKFTYDLATHKYTVETLEIDEQLVYNNVSIGFENGKITSADFTITNPKIAGYSLKMHYKDFNETNVQIPTNIESKEWNNAFSDSTMANFTFTATIGNKTYKLLHQSSISSLLETYEGTTYQCGRFDYLDGDTVRFYNLDATKYINLDTLRANTKSYSSLSNEDKTRLDFIITYKYLCPDLKDYYSKFTYDTDK